MSFSTRMLAATIGLVLPLALGTGANAATHRHHPAARVQTATYHAPHRAAHHARHTARHHASRLALAHRHTLTRGS